MCGLQNRPVADADLQNFLDPRNDGGYLVDENLQTRTDAAPGTRRVYYLLISSKAFSKP